MEVLNGLKTRQVCCLTRHKYLISASFLFCLLVYLPSTASAMSCHCFTDRDFNSAEPAAADPYYLATVQNSFYSIIFNIKKSKVVLAKQKPGATAEALWIKKWIVAKNGQSMQGKAVKKTDETSWLEALETAGVDTGNLPADFVAQLVAGDSDTQLSNYIVNDLLRTKGIASAETLQPLQQATASNQETIIAAVLSSKLGNDAIDLLQLVRDGKTTWGSLLRDAGMNGREMVAEIRSLVKLKAAAHS